MKSGKIARRCCSDSKTGSYPFNVQGRGRKCKHIKKVLFYLISKNNTSNTNHPTMAYFRSILLLLRVKKHHSPETAI